MLSDFGKRLYFPQTRHAGGLSPADTPSRAPTTGRPDLRQKWREELLRKNPSLVAKSFSLPIITGSPTHALSLIADLFVDNDDMVLLPDKFWEDYELLFGVRCQAQLGIYPFFNASNGFNVEALRQALAARAGTRKTVLVLNFSNNPTGHSITKPEAQEVCQHLMEAAQDGHDLVVVTDDAHLGRFHGEDVLQESLFARLADLHERILAIKVDGPMKEEAVRGTYTGMLTFSSRTFFSEEALYGRLGEKGCRGHARASRLTFFPAKRRWMGISDNCQLERLK